MVSCVGVGFSIHYVPRKGVCIVLVLGESGDRALGGEYVNSHNIVILMTFRQQQTLVVDKSRFTGWPEHFH